MSRRIGNGSGLPFALTLAPMIILAIDTALDASSAAVLDTDTGNTLAIESQTMQRGHAEALMPLIGRVMKASGIGFTALDRIAVTTRSRQLHRVARRPVGGARHCAGGREAGSSGCRRSPLLPRRWSRRMARTRSCRRSMRGMITSISNWWAAMAARCSAEGGPDRGSARGCAIRRAASGRQRARAFSPSAGPPTHRHR